MTKILLYFLLLISVTGPCFAQQAAPPAPQAAAVQGPPQSKSPNFLDKIPDDSKHVYSSIIITNVVGHFVFEKTDRVGLSCLVGMGTSLLVGAGKEFIWDKAMHRGVYSNDDLIFDAWGTLIGGIVLRCTIDLKQRKRYSLRSKNLLDE